MNTILKLTTVILLASCAVGHAQSKRTADYLRLDPESHKDKEVTVDVSMVKPVHWKSPLEDIAFFKALTVDRTEDKAGGWILVAVPAEDSEKFAKKYGMNFESRNDKNRLEGTFILVRGRGPSGLWIIDTTGEVPKLIKDGKFNLPDDADREEGDVLGPRGNRPRRP